VGRIPLFSPTPHVPHGFPAKAFAGEAVPFDVVAFREGHDLIGVHLRLSSPTGDETLHRLIPLADGTDRWRTTVAIDRAGEWRYRFEAFSDDYATWAHAADVKAAAGVDVPVMCALGVQLLSAAAGDGDRPADDVRTLASAAATVRDAHYHAQALPPARSPRSARSPSGCRCASSADAPASARGTSSSPGLRGRSAAWTGR
jgi:starch synthase (maltosyl-transferring)